MLKKSFIFTLFLFAFLTFSFTANATTQSIGCTYPAQILDITNWKETLPIGSSGNPTEIKQPVLATYSNDPYFVVNSECNGVQFRAPVNGVTTSGSNYQRSELREMANSGTTNASWATDSGVHTMFIDEAITAVPITKQHIVVGQVHDSSDDVIVIRLEYPKLFIDINGATGPTLDASYTLGKRFTVKFVASNGQISIYYNGNINPAYTLKKIGSGNYFKAGAYPQSNCSKELSGDCVSTNYGEVIIYNIWVEHLSLPLPTPPPSLLPPILPINSLTNNNTLIAHSNNFSADYEALKLWDGCYEGASYNSDTCTAGGRDISSFWLEFDLKKLYTISQARLYGDAEGAWVSKSWTMSYKKNNNDNWITIFSDESALFNHWSTRSLNITARYIRVEVLGNKEYSSGQTQARELEIYGVETVLSPTTTSTNNQSQIISSSNQQTLIEQLEARILELKKKISAFLQKSSISENCAFLNYLTIGSKSEDVRCLQKFLNLTGFPVSLTGPGSLGNETSYFGSLTKQAVIAWQNKNAATILTPLGLISGTGYWGASSISHYKTNH